MGFIAVGFSYPSRPVFFDQFKSWLSLNKHAGMFWLERNLHLREDPSLLLGGCRTVISLAFPHSSNKPCTTDGLTVARFSRPDREDYHQRLRRLAKALTAVLKEYDEGSRSRICVDSAPVLERSIACSSGIGFIGKNNMLIIPGAGSYFFLAEILTTIELDVPYINKIENQCGACTRCLDACPMGALERPFFINASRCLSYQTVEDKGRVSEAVAEKMGDCFFGCDRCQEVCPFNEQDQSREILLPSSTEIQGMQEEEFTERYGKTCFKRTGLEKIKSNITAIKANMI
jgi:epoxyqueuosine reductase